MSVQTSPRAKTAQEEANLRTVLEFYDAVLNKQDYDRVGDYVDPGYIQHKPDVADGIEGLLTFMRYVYANSPNHKVRIVRAFVDGDFVTLHVNVTDAVECASLAVMDIFRLHNGKLIEHWDVAQPVPTSGYLNSNTMF